MQIALYRPEIPPNTGNIARLAVCVGCPLHIIGKPGFLMTDAAVKRAGLDYWSDLNLTMHENFADFHAFARASACRIIAITKFGRTTYTDFSFQPTDILLFGNETGGLPDSVHDSVKAVNEAQLLRIPIRKNCRSLNLSNAVAIVVYEGLRQVGFPGLLDV